MPRLQGFHERLLAAYGPGRVVNVFQDTGMEARALELGIGAWVVRNAISDEQAASWHQALTGSLVDIANQKGPRSVELKGSSKKLWYRTIQMTTGFCTCKYGYEGTGRNPMLKVREVLPFQSVHDWVHESHNVPRQQHFDEVVANIYDRQKNQCIEAHTDQHDLLGTRMKSSACLSAHQGVLLATKSTW